MMNNILHTLSANWTKKTIRLIFALAILSQHNAFGQAAVYINEPFAANIPGYPTWTAGASFKTPTVDWTQAKITGGGVAPNDFQWVNAGANPVAANVTEATLTPSVGAGFIRYVNRTVAYPAISGAPNGDAAFIATRSLDWSGHTTYNAVSDTFGISVFRDGTAAALAVLDYIEVYVNTAPSLTGAVLASTTGGANRIHRSNTQAPAAAAGWNRYKFVIPNDARFYGPLFPGACGTSTAYIIIAGYSAGGNNIFIDNVNMPQWQTPMVVTAANVFITQSADVGKNSLDNVMLGVQVTTKGSITPRRLDGILFNTQGSTAFTTDVTQPGGAKCWFTGGSNSFATAGGSVSVPKVNPTTPSYTNAQLFFGYLDGVAGCPTALTTAAYNFFPGNSNFVWLAYDIPATATAANFVAGGFEQLFTGWSAPGVAGCFSDTVITSSGIQTPASFAAFTPSPSVSAIRQIVDQAYNIPTYYQGTSWPGGGYFNNDFVSGVYFPGDNSTKIDNYNHDNLCASCVGVGGQNCQRFSCHPPDYTQFKAQNMGLYMERVVQVTQGKGVRTSTPPYAVKAQCGTWFSANTVAIFIDWNKDGDFDDRYSGTGGFIYENYGSQQQVQASMALPAVWGANTSWNINVPSPADVVVDLNDANQPPNNSTGPIIVGNVRMRVREIFAAANNYPFNGIAATGVHPTNSGFTWGEVEDYTIQVLPDCPLPGSNVSKWVGATNDWNNPSNWCPALPTKNDIAYIAPGPLFPPTILDSTNAECRTLQIMPGAKVVIDATKGSSLKVYDDVVIGQGATLGTGSSLSVTSDFIKTLTIPGKSQVPPLGLALATVTPFRTNAQAKTQIAYTATELKTTYGWKAGDVIESISIEVNSISGGAGPSTYSGLRIMAYLRNAPVTFPFPAPPNTKIACMPGDLLNVAGWPKLIYGPSSTTLSMAMAAGGTQAGGNYATFNLIPGVLVWDGVSSLVLSFENWTALGLAPAKNYILYDESSPSFSVLALNYAAITGGAVNGQSISGAGTYNSPGVVFAGITAVVSNSRPRLDFKLNRTYQQFPITVGGDWINNNRNVRTAVYSTTPIYGIAGDSGFVAGNSRVIFDPTGRAGINSIGLNSTNPSYYIGTPGALLPSDIDQDITSAVTSGGNSTVFGALEIKKTSATAKSVRQVSTFTPWLTGNYADTLFLTTGELKLNRKEFILRKGSSTALTATNGWLRSEDNGAPAPGTIQSKFRWQVGTLTGMHSIPFKGASSIMFTLKYNLTAGNIGDLTVATYGTPSNNTPYPVAPQSVAALTSNIPSSGVNATPWTVDRFWYVMRSTTSTISGALTFEYDNTQEGTLSSTYVANEMKAQRYAATGWNLPTASQTNATGAGSLRQVSLALGTDSMLSNIYTSWAIARVNAAQGALGANSGLQITAIGSTTFCIGGSVVLKANNLSGINLTPLWSNGVSADSIIVTTAGNYFYTIQGAGNSDTVTVTVSNLPNALITASGPTTFCTGGSVTLSSNSSTGNLWSTGATTQSITVTTSGVYTVAVTNASGCSGVSNSITVSVGSSSSASITAVGNTTFCQGGSASLKSSTGLTYLWSNGKTTKNIAVTTAGNYFVTVTYAGGCTSISNTITITVNSNPTPVITANGPLTICDGDSLQLSSTTASAYYWSNGDADQDIYVYTAGTYNVVVTYASGCTALSANVIVALNASPTAIITPAGPTNFCTAIGSIILNANTGAGLTYIWKKNNVTIAGAVTSTYTATTTGDYAVQVTNANGCSALSLPTTVTGPPSPTFTVAPPAALCAGVDSILLTANTGAGYTYKWKLNNTNIAGAFSNTLYAKDSGDYKVVITNAFGCTKTSAVSKVANNCLPVYVAQFQAQYSESSFDLLNNRSILQTYDDGYLYSSLALINRVDSLGNFMWSKTYKLNGYGITITDVKELSDKSFVALGSVNVSGAGAELCLLKLDSLGHMQWSKRYGTSLSDGIISVDSSGCGTGKAGKLFIAKDGGYIIASVTKYFGKHKALVIKLTSAGVVEWTNAYGRNSNSYDYAIDIKQGNDSSYYLFGYSLDGSTAMFLNNISSTGNLNWGKIYPGLGAVMCNSTIGNIKLTNDAAIILTSNYTTTGGNYPYILKTNLSGNVLWCKQYKSGSSYKSSCKVLETTGKTYLLAGNGTNANNKSQNFLLKTDKLGVSVWSKNYFGNFVNSLYNVSNTKDKGFALLNYYNDQINAGDLMSIIKTDTSGNASCQTQAITDTTITLSITPVSAGIKLSLSVNSSNISPVVISNSIDMHDMCLPLRLFDKNTGSSLTVYPNPTTGKLTINPIANWDDQSKFDVAIFDVLGKLQMQKQFEGKANQIELDASYLTPGMYLLQVRQDTKVFNAKFIKE